ncbi:MAG: NAD(P)H-binding protein [Actinophytocola sp.]|nr:NAD(P)H-binding protein [Actinophytocola sp.]
MTWMVYGASGHTGKLVAELAAARGERPVLAGRSSERIAPIAAELGLDIRAFGLDDPHEIRAALGGIGTVAHCAGPFSATSRPMVDACLATGTNYVDITGEIEVFEAIYARDAEAAAAGVVLLPGAGFDVVPTDCVAACLAERLPDATHLDLAFAARVKLGPGTVKTMLEGAGQGGSARVDGKLRSVPLGHRRVTASFPSGRKTVTAIPWGDLSSAYRSTGIPNITTFTVVPAGSIVGVGQRLVAPIFRVTAVQNAAKAVVDRVVKRGVEMAEAGSSQVWGEVRNAAGQRVSMTLTGPNGLPMTADGVVSAVRKLAEGGVKPGAHTPSTAFGARFATELAGVEISEPTTG